MNIVALVNKIIVDSEEINDYEMAGAYVPLPMSDYEKEQELKRIAKRRKRFYTVIIGLAILSISLQIVGVI